MRRTARIMACTAYFLTFQDLVLGSEVAHTLQAHVLLHLCGRRGDLRLRHVIPQSVGLASTSSHASPIFLFYLPYPIFLFYLP